MSDLGKMLENGFVSRIANPDFILAVQMGLVPGFSTIAKFGHNPEITTESEPEDIWHEGGLYTFSTDQLIDTASCVDPLDVGQIMVVEGILNADTIGNIETGETRGYFVTNGDNKVLLYDTPTLDNPIKYLRINRAYNISPDTPGGPLRNSLYIYEDTALTAGKPTDVTKIRAKIQNGDNQTQQAIYTVPPKKVVFLYRGEMGVIFTGNPSSGNNYARGTYRSRGLGRVFRINKTVSVMVSASSTYQDARSFPDAGSAMADIRLVIEEVSATMGVWGTFDLLVVDENLLPVPFLQRITQPGF